MKEEKMNIFVIGGTGFLGSHLVSKLKEKNHEVAVLTRDRRKVNLLQEQGIRGIVGDICDPGSFLGRLERQDAVVMIAKPEIIPGKKVSKRQFGLLRKGMNDFFVNSIEIAKRFNAPVILTSGASFRTSGAQVADETWFIDRSGIARIGIDTDEIIRKAMESGTPPVIQMLPAQIYGNGGLFKDVMYDWMKKGKFRVIGSGNNYIPRIHVEDCAEAYVKTIEKMPVGERFIIADDQACTVREFCDYMAECMKVPKPKSVPKFLIRLVLGELMYETVTMNCRVSNERAKRVLGWKLQYPTYREGLRAAIDEIEGKCQTL